MDAMEKKKQALRAYLNKKKTWEYWSNEVKRLSQLDTKVTPSLTGMPHGGGPDGSKQEVAVEELEYAREKLAESAAHARDARDEVVAIIETAQNVDQRIVLLRRYIAGISWEQIAEMAGKSRQWATLVHGAALKSITIAESGETEKKKIR